MESGVCLETTNLYFEHTLDQNPSLYDSVAAVISYKDFIKNKNNNKIIYYNDIFLEDVIKNTTYVENEFLDHYPIMQNYTSGSTGVKKQIIHNYTSLIAAAKNASTLYTVGERILSTHAINHLGVVTMHILGPILAGAQFFMCKDIADLYFLTNRKLIDTFSGFEAYIKNLLRIHKSLGLALDLTGIKVITGGASLSINILDILFAIGVSEVMCIYGASECLPPVMYRRLFKDSPYVTDYNSLGTVMPGYDIKIQEDKVLISGPSASDYSKDSDGYVHLNDKLKFENDTYYFMGKEQYLKSHVYQDILRLTEEYSTQLNYPLFNSDFDYGLKNDQIYLLLDPILISLVNIDVDHFSNFLKNNNINLDIAGILPKSKIVADAIKGNKIHLL
jgi:acyl-coenzyme A synthetase/AMP-(fatty) acid ligase